MPNDQESRETLAITYRIYAKEAEDRALNAPRLDVCEGYLNLASGWQKLADEIVYTN